VPSHLDLFGFNDDDSEDDADAIPANVPPALSPSLYRKKQTLEFDADGVSDISIPKQSKTVSPFDDGDPEYDYGVFGFDKYDHMPQREHNQPYAKGPISNNHLEVLADVSRKFENHIRFLSGPDQLNRSVAHLKAMLFQITNLNSDKRTTSYNAFVHEFRKNSSAKGDAFLSEAALAWSELKSSYEGSSEGWKAKSKELVEEYEKEKADVVKSANQWNEGHINLMEILMDKMAQQVRINPLSLSGSFSYIPLGPNCWGKRYSHCFFHGNGSVVFSICDATKQSPVWHTRSTNLAAK
jgi:hypothetical protein